MIPYYKEKEKGYGFKDLIYVGLPIIIITSLSLKAIFYILGA